MIQEDFKFYKPCKPLQPYVRYYWVFSSNQLLSTYTFPIGCPQFIFHKRTPLFVPELGTTQDKLTISGQVNFSSHLEADNEVEMIVVVFYPHTINMFLNTPVSVFYNKEISGYDINDRQPIEDCILHFNKQNVPKRYLNDYTPGIWVAAWEECRKREL